MTVPEARIRVRLDTDDAKREIEELKNRLRDASSGMTPGGGGGGGGASSPSGSRFGGFGGFGGLGTIGNAATGELTGPTASSGGDILGEALGAHGAAIEKFIFGDLGPDARASRTARDQTIAAFGHLGPTAQARTFYAATKQVALRAEMGRQAFQNDEFFRGPDVRDLAKVVGAAIAEGSKKSFDAMTDNILQWFTGGFGYFAKPR